MLRKKVLIPTENISRQVAHFTIGFAALSVKDRVEDAKSAGSGTLVTIGSINGILTAAHVVDALPRSGPVGLVLYSGTHSTVQKQTLKMEHADSVVIRGDTFGPKGPDLAFLR